MSYVGRVEVRLRKDGKELEVLEMHVMPRRGWRGNEMIYEHQHESFYLDEAMAGRADGVHDLRATYHEEFWQDHEGEWDGRFWLEWERAKYVGK